MGLRALIWLALAGAQEAPPPDAPPPEDEEDLEVVVVTASRSPSARGNHPVAVEVIGREEIEASGAESLAEVLQEQPGVQIDRQVTGVAVRLQGLDPEHTLVLVDGQRVLGAKDGTIDLARFALDSVERIELVKGPSSALYGSDAMGGVIHIITRKPEDARELGLHVRGGTLGRLDATADLSVATESVRHRLAGGWHAAGSWDADPSDVATTASGYQQGDFDYAVTVDPGADTQVDGRVSYMQRRLAGIDANATGAVFDRIQIVEDSRASVGAWITPGDTNKLSARLSGSWFREQTVRDQRGSRSLDSSTDNREQLAEATLQYDHGFEGSTGSHFATLGIDGLAQQIQSDRLGPGKGDRQRIAAFGQHLWSLGDEDGVRFQLSPGARIDVDTQFGSAFTPRIAASLAASDFTVRLGAGTGFRAPDFRELYLRFENPGVGYIVAGSEDLEPERSASANVGVDWDGDGASLSVGGFFNDVRNLIQVGSRDIEPGALQVFAYENIARARTAGVELQGKTSPGPFDLELSYTGTWTRDLDAQEPLGNRVPHRITGVVGVELPEDIRVRAQTGYSSPRTLFVNADGIEVPVNTAALVSTDLRASWSFEPFEVFAGVDNVFDSLGSALTPLMPRFVYVGFNARGRVQR